MLASQDAAHPKFPCSEIASCLADRVNTPMCEQLKSLIISIPPNIMENPNVRTKDRQVVALFNALNITL
jgi:hypothetical protein